MQARLPRTATLRRRIALVCAALVVASFSRPANAQSADALIDRGVEQRRSGDDEAALESFTSAWERGQSPRARAQMALAEQALGRFVEAEAHLTEALTASNDEWIARRRPDLLVALEAIRQRLGYLEIRGGVDGADVRIDGRSVATLPLAAPLRLVTGSFRLEVVARGYYPAARQVTVVSDATTRETIELTASPGAPGSVDLTSASLGSHADHGGGRGALAGATFGVGGALLATSATFFLVRQHRAADFNSDACLAGGRTRAENCQDTYDGAIRAQRTSAATLAVGVAALGAATVLLITGGNDSEEPVAVSCGADLGSTWGARCAVRF